MRTRSRASCFHFPHSGVMENEQRSVGGQYLPVVYDPPKTSPAGRTCEECDTVLSRYNHTDRCSEHCGPRSARRSLLRTKDDMS